MGNSLTLEECKWAFPHEFGKGAQGASSHHSSGFHIFEIHIATAWAGIGFAGILCLFLIGCIIHRIRVKRARTLERRRQRLKDTIAQSDIDPEQFPITDYHARHFDEYQFPRRKFAPILGPTSSVHPFFHVQPALQHRPRLSSLHFDDERFQECQSQWSEEGDATPRPMGRRRTRSESGVPYALGSASSLVDPPPPKRTRTTATENSSSS